MQDTEEKKQADTVEEQELVDQTIDPEEFKKEVMDAVNEQNKTTIEAIQAINEQLKALNDKLDKRKTLVKKVAKEEPKQEVTIEDVNELKSLVDEEFVNDLLEMGGGILMDNCDIRGRKPRDE